MLLSGVPLSDAMGVELFFLARTVSGSGAPRRFCAALPPSPFALGGGSCLARQQKDLCAYLQLNKKKAKAEGINVTLKTIMSTIADKTVNKITHHVPPRQIIYTKKQIGWNHEKR